MSAPRHHYKPAPSPWRTAHVLLDNTLQALGKKLLDRDVVAYRDKAWAGDPVAAEVLALWVTFVTVGFVTRDGQQGDDVAVMIEAAQDVVQRGIEGWDPTKGSLETWLRPRVKGAMKDARAERFVAAPSRHQREKASQLDKARLRAMQELEREPSDDELAARLRASGASLWTHASAAGIAAFRGSLPRRVGLELDHGTVPALMTQPANPTATDAVERLLPELPPQQREAVTHYWGVDGAAGVGPSATKDIAIAMNVSQRRVQQELQSGMKALKVACERLGIDAKEESAKERTSARARAPVRIDKHDERNSPGPKQGTNAGAYVMEKGGQRFLGYTPERFSFHPTKKQRQARGKGGEPKELNFDSHTREDVEEAWGHGAEEGE